MRQGAGQSNPDPVSLGSPSAPRRRSGRRRWLVLLLALLAPPAVGLWGWFHPTDAWLLVRSAVVGSVVGIVRARDQRDIPERARPRWTALAIGLGVLCAVAGPVGAWLAR